MNKREIVLELVEQIPLGFVSSYGRIAILSSTAPRYVARVLAGLPDETHIPWHRVINSQGKISPHPNAGGSSVQKMRLESEGLVFEANGSIRDWKSKIKP